MHSLCVMRHKVELWLVHSRKSIPGRATDQPPGMWPMRCQDCDFCRCCFTTFARRVPNNGYLTGSTPYLSRNRFHQRTVKDVFVLLILVPQSALSPFQARSLSLCYCLRKASRWPDWASRCGCPKTMSSVVSLSVFPPLLSQRSRYLVFPVLFSSHPCLFLPILSALHGGRYP
jgi:hypothetical protein